MPIIIIDASPSMEQGRAQLAHDLTNVMSKTGDVTPADVHVFVDPASGTPSVRVFMVGPAPSGLAAALQSVIPDKTARIEIRAYAPDYTARSGLLRQSPAEPSDAP